MKLVMFCDYGLDDAVATVDVMTHWKEDGFDEVDIVPVGGNVPTEIALRNAKKLIAGLTFPLPRITVVDTTCIPQPAEFLKDIHGGDGMGDLIPDADCSVPVIGFFEWISTLKEGFVLLSLGPMTLVKYALEKKPSRFIFMGGNISERPNYGDYEFNHGVNPEEFSRCVRFPHVAITMDTCRCEQINIQQRKIEGRDLMHMLVRRSKEMTFHSGEIGCYVWDDIAVKYMRHPEWFSLYEAYDRDKNRLTVAKYMQDRTYVEIMEE